MSKVRLRIRRLVLDGVPPGDRRAIVAALARETAAAIAGGNAVEPRVAPAPRPKVLQADSAAPVAIGRALARHVVKRSGA